MRKKKSRIAFCGILLLAGLTGCSLLGIQESKEPTILLDDQESYEKEKGSQAFLEDDGGIYSDQLEEVSVVYLTVGRGNKEEDTDHSWKDVNSAAAAEAVQKDRNKIQCEALLQLGDEDAPLPGEFGYGAQSANALIRLYGKKAVTRQQKSYIISIKKGNGSLDGMKKVILSKEFTDPLRITDKFCFELIREIPGMFSNRSRMVHLYVKDRTKEEDSLFVDYGLYTMMEPIDKNYFVNRNLSDNASIYKAENFDWARHEDVIKEATDAGYSEKKFEKLLEIKGEKEHANLMELLDVVNDPSLDIYDTVKTYFSEDNIYNYMAFCILMGKKDAAQENYVLYNPEGVKQFYLIPWDNDSALRDAYKEMSGAVDRQPWKQGIFSFTDSLLFARMMQNEKCRNKLQEHMDTIFHTILSEKKVNAKLRALERNTKDLLYELPDQTYARVTQEEYEQLSARVYEQMETNFYTFYDTLEMPWPFHILEPESKDGKVTLHWEESYQADSYSVVVDDSWDFQTPVIQQENVTATSLDLGQLKAGQYFVKVTAKTAAGKEQGAKEFYNTEKKTTVNGCLCFYVDGDGKAKAAYMTEGE